MYCTRLEGFLYLLVFLHILYLLVFLFICSICFHSKRRFVYLRGFLKLWCLVLSWQMYSSLLVLHYILAFIIIPQVLLMAAVRKGYILYIM